MGGLDEMRMFNVSRNEQAQAQALEVLRGEHAASNYAILVSENAETGEPIVAIMFAAPEGEPVVDLVRRLRRATANLNDIGLHFTDTYNNIMADLVEQLMEEEAGD